MVHREQKKCNYVLDDKALDKLRTIQMQREQHIGTAKEWTKRSQIIRDAIDLQYRAEVLQQSFIHPKNRDSLIYDVLQKLEERGCSILLQNREGQEIYRTKPKNDGGDRNEL